MAFHTKGNAVLLDMKRYKRGSVINSASSTNKLRGFENLTINLQTNIHITICNTKKLVS
jgi:hypothetical protein